MIEKFKKDIQTLWMRFPISISFATLLALVLLITDGSGDRKAYPIFYLSMGTLISYFLHLVTEDFKNPKGTRSMRLWMACHLALVADLIWLALKYGDESWPKSVYWMNGALMLLFCVGSLTVPFRKEKNDNQFWNFTWKLSIAGMIAIGAGIATFTCIEILWEGFTKMFEIRKISSASTYVAIITLVYLPIQIFHILTPKGEAKHNPIITPNKILSGFCHYLLLPVAGLYLIVLYGYELKIILTWELPKGEVSLLVSTLMALVLGVVALLYPSLKNNESMFDKKVVRVVPLMTLPLLVLMSVGIIRRFSDYGMTPDRLYVATLNIWFYAMAILLALGRMKRISLIPISFALILMLTSAQPFNYNELCRRHMLGKISGIVEQYQLGDAESIKKWIGGDQNSDDRETLLSCIKYLDKENFQNDLAEALALNKDCSSDNAKELVRSLTSGATRTVKEYSFNCNKTLMSIPSGYKEFRTLEYNDYNDYEFISNDKVRFTTNDRHVFIIDLEGLKDTEKQNEPYIVKSTDGKTMIMLTRITANIYNQGGHFWVVGYLFRK